jgi:hypothetical protein
MTYDPHVWLVWSREHNAWWRPAAAGYCTSVLDAGRFTLEEATDHCNLRSRVAGEQDPEVMIHVDDALKGPHGLDDYAQCREWIDELDPLLWVPPTTKTPAQQFRELKESSERFRCEVIDLRCALTQAEAELRVGDKYSVLAALQTIRDALAAQVPREPANGTGWKS